MTGAPLLFAIVGRPNVGKSTLFNRFVGGRPALVHDKPGVTRDRRYGHFLYDDREIRVVDTGGLDPEAEKDAIGAGIHRQAFRAIEEADAVIFVVDGEAGLLPIDQELARKLRKLGRPWVCAVNKIDHPKREAWVPQMQVLGIDDVFAISAMHGRGIEELLDRLLGKLEADQARTAGLLAKEANRDSKTEENNGQDFDQLNAELDDEDFSDASESSDEDSGEDFAGEDSGEDFAGEDFAGEDQGDSESDGEDFGELDGESDDDGFSVFTGEGSDDLREEAEEKPDKKARVFGQPREDEPLRVALVGKPNAGKSSLLNRLVGHERSLVHDQPGTTTDPVDSLLSFGGKEYLLVDTAGIRRKARIDEDMEKISVTLSLSQIERAEVVVLVIDGALGPSEQDARLAGLIQDAGKAMVIALNKSDLLPPGRSKGAELREKTKDTMHFLSWAPTHFMSAQNGQGVTELLRVIDKVAKEHRRRITTSDINRFFAEVCEVVPPPTRGGQTVRIHYLTQGGVRPPTFILWANRPKHIDASYRRFLMNQFRRRYGFAGTPVRIIVKEKRSGGDRPRKLVR